MLATNRDAELYHSAPIPIEKEWIDYNGHLNMAYYNVVFDRGGDEFLSELGFGPTYAAERKLTIYTAEVHICYVQELHLDDVVTVTNQLIDYDSKRLHTYLEIIHKDGWVAATCEVLSLHVDMSGPKVTPFPEDVLPKLEFYMKEHAQLPAPDRVGRAIGIKKK
ncbi:(3S)-malyl-CoA thioesterase [Phyllobacterium sp. YR620]|uniref:Thioesterase family protein n=1 Tax=Phyllobacterium pellucidum TaxID=2740464 RepID=A0A849VK83_9HYPH|nr:MULTISPECIES: thioesterase family protein [Phyllobacterium]NTS29676.1 thioesterase family protein [Phyllobacterium pellucidum]UGY08441.1 thioesterase family protein [Phyllobacterium sp. T1018]SDP62424.1 (3S)-malyl-CoA thioesterase [Phyllobacterium sp. YR620]SFJ12313.1 (3S)-malyl-CoA thioesterase [Phyllobacterium sp. CL33Tsu]